jgi:hypothetical protein
VSEEVQGQITGGNGERLEVRLGTKSLGLTTRDLPLIVLMALMGVGFYLAFTRLTAGQDQSFTNQREGFQKLGQILELLHTNQTAMLDEIRGNREQMGSLVAQQNMLLVEQTKTLFTLMKEQTAALHRDMTEVMRRLAVLSYNDGRPLEQRIPLELSPPRELP